jgi:hypothetical protein
MDRGYIVIYPKMAVLCTKKELPVLKYMSRSYVVTRHHHVVIASSSRRHRVVVMSLISHRYDD